MQSGIIIIHLRADTLLFRTKVVRSHSQVFGKVDCLDRGRSDNLKPFVVRLDLNIVNFYIVLNVTQMQISIDDIFFLTCYVHLFLVYFSFFFFFEWKNKHSLTGMR